MKIRNISGPTTPYREDERESEAEAKPDSDGGDSGDAAADEEWTTESQRRAEAPKDDAQSIGRTRDASPNPADRGQSNIIGAAIIVGTFALLFVSAQVSLAPQVRQETEFDHARTVLAQMSQVQANTVTALSSGAQQAAVVQMGGSYPSYLILIQPPGPSGAVRTGEQQDLSISGVQAVDPEVQDLYLSGTPTVQEFTTQPIRFQPNYVSYQDPPTTVIEHNVLYEDYSGDSAPTDASVEVEASTNVVNGKRINLVSTPSDLSRSQSRALLLKQKPLSAGGEAVRVTDAGGHIRIAIETDVPLAEWRRMLGSEIDPDTGAGDSSDGDREYISAIENNAAGDGIVIHLEADEQYQLNAGKVGYRGGYQAPFAESADPGPAYLDLQSNPEPTVQEGGSTMIEVNLRDKFHNGVENEPVTVSITPPAEGSIDDSDLSKQSRPDGTVRFRYEAPNNVNNDKTDRVVVQFDGGGTAPKEVVVEVEVINTDGSGPGP
jgi:hypothetical protein